ncbi:hypothetical protein [Alteromonas sp. MmMcT2-5]|uniref:hypothetical protein n=1 Tax=Alteromonas sp. MmMcT2-5 TaxID=2917733 RepID=UPI001EF28E56|nr:hypothetical protein [Alteromonas sp. MmMcT2-5]MCG7650990.1 hypothetical protein [Alteromonas sp. MmMcT2-5]
MWILYHTSDSVLSFDSAKREIISTRNDNPECEEEKDWYGLDCWHSVRYFLDRLNNNLGKFGHKIVLDIEPMTDEQSRCYENDDRAKLSSDIAHGREFLKSIAWVRERSAPGSSFYHPVITSNDFIVSIEKLNDEELKILKNQL